MDEAIEQAVRLVRSLRSRQAVEAIDAFCRLAGSIETQNPRLIALLAAVRAACALRVRRR